MPILQKSKHRKILIVIERRADYSRFKPILEKLKDDPFFKIYIIVTGICLLDKHGKDINYIKNDGFKITSTIPMFKKNSPDTGAEMARALSRVLFELTDKIEKIRPDIVLTGFDIGANFAATVAAAHMNIPVAHIQGGEITGSIDESLRHAMSKFAHIHFPATKLSKQRLIRLGEDPKNIFVVGCPSIDVLVNTPYIPKEELENEFNIDFSKPTILLIQHPITTENNNSYKQIKETISAINDLKIQALASLPNNDAGFSKILKTIKQSKIHWYPSLPTVKFVNLFRNIWTLVGNSSAGIHETPTLRIPAVNIGTRQQGRERAKNVIDVPYDRKMIRKAIKKSIYDKKFRNSIKKITNPYGDGRSSEKIVNILKVINLDGIIQKRFYE